MLAQNHPVWSEVLRTGQHGVMEDIDQESARMCVGSGVNAFWHQVLEDTDPDPAMRLLKNHLRGLGVRTIPVRAKPGVGTEILVELKNQPASKPDTGNEQS